MKKWTIGILFICATASAAILWGSQTIKGNLTVSGTVLSPTIQTPTVDVQTLDGQAGSPSNPSSGYYKFYVKDDGFAYLLNSSGTETQIMQSAFAPNDQFAIENLTLAFSVAASAATIAVKTQAGTDASATDRIYVGMRSATLTSGVYNRRTITGALSVVLSSGSTLGQTSAAASRIYVYLIDNAGTLELAVSHMAYAEDALVTTTAEGGAGAADSATAIYSTTARSNVPIRCIGYILNTQATAGTWASTATQIQLLPAQTPSGPTVTRLTSGSGTYNVPAGVKWIRVRMVGGGAGGAGVGASGSSINAGGAGGNTTFGTSLLTANGGTVSSGVGQTTRATCTVNSPALSVYQNEGVPGQSMEGSASFKAGGTGGSSPFGGAGWSGPPNSTGTAAAANSGSGGGGGTWNGGGGFGAPGGSSGAYIEAVIPIGALLSSYAYSIGAGGTAGAAGGGNAMGGGAGGSGVIVIEEYYN